MLLIPVLLLATCIGLLLAPFCLLPASVAYLAICGGLLLALLARKHLAGLYFSTFLCCVVLANLHYSATFPKDDFVEQLGRSRQKLTVTAELQQLTHKSDNRSQLDLQILQLRDNDRLLALPGDYRLRLFISDQVSGLLPGDRLRFRTRLRQPRLFGTPGEFHWPRYLASQDIALTGWLKTAAQLQRVGEVEVFPARPIAAWKAWLSSRIDAVVVEPQAVLLRTLLLGESRLLPDPLREQLAAAGISHLFAISGLHLGLLGLFGYRLLLLLYRRSPWLLNWQPPQRVLPFFLLPVLLGYLLLTGDAVSTRRAFCVATVAAVLLLGRYTVNPLRLLQLLALLFLWANPLLLWQPAWQLSFAGAAGILLWRPLWQGQLASSHALLRGPLQLLLISTAATLATLPLVVGNFHLWAPASLLANLLAVPLVALLALPIGLCGIMLAWLPLLGGVCWQLSGWLLQLVIQLTEELLTVPGFAAEYLFWSRWQYLALALAVWPLLFIGQPFFKGRSAKLVAWCLLLLTSCAFIDQQQTGLKLYMFSVGQGESMLLVDERGRTILIDGGGLYSDRFDVGQRLLAPALGWLGVRKLDAVLLTHDHPDHRKGLIFILRQFPVGQFWTAESLDKLHPTLRNVLAERRVAVRRLPAGWSPAAFPEAGGIWLFHAPDSQDKNNSSVALYLRGVPGGVLLTGDLEREGVDRLLAAGLPGPVSLLKLPHHGSRHSGTEKMLRRYRPEFSLVSAGYQNRYRFPAAELRAELERLNIPLYRSDLQGTIRVQASGDRWQIDCWHDGLFH